ncbi:MAG: hypothetical protein P4M11_07515 [Candidatus Pacebacteria bacterium]|nr:hypothetical protein [Candidatus Paceibacterota bacterium]
MLSLVDNGWAWRKQVHTGCNLHFGGDLQELFDAAYDWAREKEVHVPDMDCCAKYLSSLKGNREPIIHHHVRLYLADLLTIPLKPTRGVAFSMPQLESEKSESIPRPRRNSDSRRMMRPSWSPHAGAGMGK